MTQFLKARPTTYRGIDMRSRLEARFAAGLDTLGLPWVYEPRAFADGHSQYLPDFELTSSPLASAVFVEVKPTTEFALAALPKADVIFASRPDACFVVACPPMGDFVLLRRGDVTHTMLGCWARWDFPDSGPIATVVPLELEEWATVERAAQDLAGGVFPQHFDWSWS